MVARERDPDDGRVVRLAPTREGVATCERIEVDLAIEYAELLSDFEPEVQAATAEVLRRLGRAFARRVDVSNGRCCVVPASNQGHGP